MSLSVSGTSDVVNAMLAPSVNTPATAAPAAPPVDFGPAATFTPSVFNGAVELQMYNGAGAAVGVAYTQWLSSGSLPAPGAASPAATDDASSAAAT